MGQALIATASVLQKNTRLFSRVFFIAACRACLAAAIAVVMSGGGGFRIAALADQRRREFFERLCFFLVAENLSGFQVEIPAMDLQFSRADFGRDPREGHQIVERDKNDGLLQCPLLDRRAGVAKLGLDGFARGGGDIHPRPDEFVFLLRHFAVGQSHDTTAHAVAEHNDMLDLERLDREFNRRAGAVVRRVVTVRRHDGGHVAHDEQISGLAARDQRGVGTGIRTGNNQCFRRLAAAHQLVIDAAVGLKVVFVKIPVALHEFSERHIFFLLLRRTAYIITQKIAIAKKGTLCMNALHPYKGILPTIGRRVWLAPGAQVVGDVEIGEEAGIWYNCVIRGDVNNIKIGARTNIQDGTVIHVSSTLQGTYIGADVTVGYMALLHACTVEDAAFIGMQACVMDGAYVESGAMVAAGALVTPGKRVPTGQLWGGSPARFMRDLTAEEKAYIPYSAKHYVELAARYL